MAKPPKAELKDYVWCIGCAAYVPKTLLIESRGDIFADDGRSCPAGHTELQDTIEAPSDPPKPG